LMELYRHRRRDHYNCILVVERIKVTNIQVGLRGAVG
jgi:hypothetical protein